VFRSLPRHHAGRVTSIVHGTRRPARRRFTLRLAPTRQTLCLTTDDARIERYIRATYGALMVDLPSPDPPADEAQLLATELPARRSLHFRSGAYQVDQFVWHSLAGDADWMPVYGCTFTIGGRAAIVVGESGIGKTTLGLALTAFGARLGGDEMVLLHRSSRCVVALHRSLTVRTAGLAALVDERTADVVRRHGTALGEKAAGIVTLDPGTWGPLPGPRPLAAVVIAQRGESGPLLTPLSPARAAIGMRRYLMPRPRDLAGVAALAELIGAASSFALTMGRPRATARTLLDGIWSHDGG
jgi:hypothetical protein